MVLLYETFLTVLMKDVDCGVRFCRSTHPLPMRCLADIACRDMQAAEQAAEGNKIFEKIKDALPFGTLPVFDLAELSKDDADMGPNEVDKEFLATGFQNSNNPFDTAMPGAELSQCTPSSSPVEA